MRYESAGSVSHMVVSDAGSILNSVRRVSMLERMLSTAIMFSTSVTANSPASRTAIQRRAGRTATVVEPFSVNVSRKSTFDTCSADGSPQTNTLPRQTALSTASTRPSIVNAIQYGSDSGGTMPWSALKADHATKMPNAPASPARAALSTSS